MSIRKQRFFSWLAVGCFVLSVVFAPWRMVQSSPYPFKIEFSPLWMPPEPKYDTHEVSLMAIPLAFEWAAIAVLAVGLRYAFPAKALPRGDQKE